MGDQDRQIPDTVDEMLAGMAEIDVAGLKQLGHGIGAVYNGIAEETGDGNVAAMLAATWTTAMVQNPNNGQPEE